MNNHDRNNLEFLLALAVNGIDLAAWEKSQTEDDVEYASELLIQHVNNLYEEIQELLTEQQMAQLDGDFVEADLVIRAARA